MDVNELIRLLNTDHYSPAILEEVNDLCRNYPMFNLAHMLRVRIRMALGQSTDEELKMAAIYAADRSRLMELVREMVPPVAEEEVTETGPEESDGIHFSDESTQEAEVIIFQHAPYAAPDQESELLELDEEPAEDPLKLAEEEEQEEELSSENLVGLVVKDDADMEEPEVSEIPKIDVEEPEVESEPEVDENPEVEEEPEVAEEPEVEEEPEVAEKPEAEEKPEVAEKPEADEKPEDLEKPGTPPSEVSEKKTDRVPENKELIERFIHGDPGPIRADRETTLKGDVSLDSVREHDGFITDTLAKIYVKQGLYAKAIYAYEKLSLKYPEKSAYFAAQIEKIKDSSQL